MELKNMYKILDERFSIEKIENYDLIIEVHATRFKFIVKEYITGFILCLEDHYWGVSESDIQLANQIHSILNNHLFLKANFWNSIRVYSDNPFYCFIPEAFFKEKLAAKYLKTHFPLLDLSKFEIFNENIDTLNMVWGFSKSIIEVFSQTFVSKKIIYSLSILNAITYFKKDNNLVNKNIFIVSDTWVDILLKTKESEDLKIFKHPIQSKKMNDTLDWIEKEGQIKSLIYGEITSYSQTYKLIKDKLKAIEFGRKPEGSKLSQNFSEIPDQRYFTLFANP